MSETIQRYDFIKAVADYGEAIEQQYHAAFVAMEPAAIKRDRKKAVDAAYEHLLSMHERMAS